MKNLNEFVDLLVAAHKENTPYPSLSAQTSDQANLELAYEVQSKFLEQNEESIIGYKAALTAAPAQKMMGIGEAIMGALYKSGDFPANETITPNRSIVVETELGFRTNQTITEPVTPDTVTRIIGSCRPMIELASPNLATKPNGVDMVGANAASYGYIEGAVFDWQDSNIDDLRVRFLREDEVLHDTTAGTVMDGQCNALSWLINKVLAAGYPLPEGSLLMTGSIGAPHPGKPGAYRGEFESVGAINFTLNPAS